MLSVSKIGAGQEAYYLDAVAQGVEDYYLGHGEAPGRWTGSASGLLGLAGQVNAEDLRAVLEGREPRDGLRLIQARKDRVPGFDLTFSAPKSVSVLYGLGDPDVVRAVRAAHDCSVSTALAWLEREAAVSRRGADGTEVVDTAGFVAAAFVHRASRAGDPQLHTHVLVANLTRCDDGIWRALHGLPLYWQARTAGYLYKAQLRHELTASLGLDWGPVHKGAAEIASIPAELCALFSTRRHEIEDELEARNAHTPQAARIAALETRQAKNYGVDVGALRDQWRARAREAGHDPAVVDEALHRVIPSPLDNAEVEAGIEHLLGPKGLTEQATTFDRRAVLRAWCEQLPRGAQIATIERIASEALADPRFVPLVARDPYSRYSTVDLVALERELVEQALAIVDAGIGVVPEAQLRAALDRRPELSPEQVAAVATITGSGNGLDVIVGAAGTGKTFCLDAAHDAWSRAGYRVVGMTLAASAARHLQAQTAIPSDTIARRLRELADDTLQLDARTVVVIDEAAMAATRAIAPILTVSSRASAKVVMLGDPHQLDAIDAGGLLLGLSRRMRTLTLKENWRQREEWERKAIAELRRGRTTQALAAYEQHQRVVVAPTAIDVRNQMAADWYAATVAGDSAVLIAERRYDVEDLNRRARRHLARAGGLTGAALDVGTLSFQAGDRVMCLRNNRRLGVQNGTLATVERAHVTERAIDIRSDDGRLLHLPQQYLDADHLTYGYARTIHKTQGLSVDRCLILASDTLDHQAGYTALSRGRSENRIYLVEQPEVDLDAHFVPQERPEPLDQLAAALRTDRGQHLARDHGIDATALRLELADLCRQRATLDHTRRAMPPDRRADINALERERDARAHEVDITRRDLNRLARQRPKRRERTTHAAALLAAERRHEHARRGQQRVQAALAHAQCEQRAHDEYTHANRTALDDLAKLEHRISDRLDIVADAAAQHPPPYLPDLGTPAATGWERDLWRRAVRDIEAYRVGHNVTDNREPLGPTPEEPSARADWRRATASFTLHKHMLDAARQNVPLEQGVEMEL
jgi:conjugative relaxase-like TrwC/TraI family protein